MGPHGLLLFRKGFQRVGTGRDHYPSDVHSFPIDSNGFENVAMHHDDLARGASIFLWASIYGWPSNKCCNSGEVHMFGLYTPIWFSCNKRFIEFNDWGGEGPFAFWTNPSG